MAKFPKQNPPKESKKPHWNFHRMPGGTVLKAWIVGPMVEINGHYIGHTKPCRYEMSSGAIPCQHDHGSVELIWRGYVPLIDEDEKRTVVMVCENMRERVPKIALFSPVWAMRGEAEKDSVTVAFRESVKKWVPLSDTPKQGYDIEDWLLRFWGDGVLVEYFAKIDKVSDVKHTKTPSLPLSPPTDEERDKGWEETQRLAELVKKRLKVRESSDPPTLGDILPPSANGTHQKP